MPNLHIKSPGLGAGVYPVATRGKEMKHLSFTIVQLDEGLNEHSFATGEEEVSLDFYSGPVRVEVEASGGGWSADIAARASIQHAHPMVYIPMDLQVRITALDGPAKITIGGARGVEGRSRL